MTSPSSFLDVWNELIRLLDCPAEASQAVGQELLARHQEAQRSYHTVEHIEAVIRHLRFLDADTPVTLLAAFFHDAVYDPTAGDNEERSAVLATNQLAELGVGANIVNDVAAIIRATNGHALPPDAPAGTAAFLDADLAVLGAVRDDYVAYAAAIRAEYAHMTDDAYRAGRAQVLAHFAERDDLYFTAAGRETWDVAARRNLRTELEELTTS